MKAIAAREANDYGDGLLNALNFFNQLRRQQSNSQQMLH